MTKPAVRILHSISDTGRENWDACANPAGEPFHPFVAWDFLWALEKSESATASTGWQPFHLAAEVDGQTVGVMPLYLKGHSRGEYVFDHGWADAWHRAGGHYYPKLQSSIPFTPVTGPRLLAATPEARSLLLNASVQVARQTKVSSLHLTFLPQSQWRMAGDNGFLLRMDQQFHWHNAGYATWEQFLAEISSRKRKNLRRERREATAADIKIEWVTGADLREHHWDAFYRFYQDTGSRKWGLPYLTRQFFSLVGERLRNHVLLILCKRAGRYIAGALNFIGSDALYGRNWGCIEDHRFLHFEACYYQAIDFAIAHGLARVEAGAQGPHKVARGYLPEATYSAHWIQDARFRQAVANYLDAERRQVSEDINWVEAHNPFRSGTDLKQIRESAPRPPREDP